MAFKLASLFVEIGGDDAPLNRKLADIRGKLGKLAATRFHVPGGGFLAALGLGAAGAGIGAAIKGASDLTETVDKTGIVFGQSASQVIKASDEMAKAFGIPKREFLDAASMFGLIATGMGKSKEAAAEFSIRMARLAIDASSLHNIDVPVALEKIRAGLTGESEPLKALGVIMDETTMKAYALSHGLARQGQEMTNEAKLAARVALIEQGLATSRGNLAQTANGAANQVRKFWGSLTNLGDTVGGAILPAFTNLVTLLNEIATDMGNAATSGQSSWSEFFGFFQGAIETAGTIYRNWGDIVERTGVMIGGFLQRTWERLEYGGEVAAATGKFIWGEMVAAFGIVVGAAGNAKDNIVNIFTEVWEYIRSMGENPIEFRLKPILDGVKVEGDGKLNLPKLKLSSVDDQLAEIDKRMTDREADRGAKQFDAAQKAKGAAGPAGPAGPLAGGGKAAKVGVTDADAYARELQEGALNGGKDIQKDILDQAIRQTQALERIEKKKMDREILAGGWA